jgi:hypothetical protein
MLNFFFVLTTTKFSKNNINYNQIYYKLSLKIAIRFKIINSRIYMVEVNGFEPMTSCVQGRRSPS